MKKKDTTITFKHLELPNKKKVVEKKNRSFQKMTRTMLNEFDTAKCFWAETINTSYYVLNRVTLIPKLKRTPYKL